jgi:hypothetical protein
LEDFVQGNPDLGGGDWVEGFAQRFGQGLDEIVEGDFDVAGD